MTISDYFLGLTVLFDRDVAEHSGCGRAYDSRRALIAVIDSLPSGGERIQLYRTIRIYN